MIVVKCATPATGTSTASGAAVSLAFRDAAAVPEQGRSELTRRRANAARGNTNWVYGDPTRCIILPTRYSGDGRHCAVLKYALSARSHSADQRIMRRSPRYARADT